MKILDYILENMGSILIMLFVLVLVIRVIKGIGMSIAVRSVRIKPTEKNAARLTKRLYHFHHGYTASDQRLLRGAWHIARNSPKISYEGKVALRDAMLSSGLLLTKQEMIIDRENCRQ